LNSIEGQRRRLDSGARTGEFHRHRQTTISMLLEGHVHRALDVHAADGHLQDRYGRNSFGSSPLMARQFVEAWGAASCKVNLGNDESWDTHEVAIRNRKDFLLPPTDRDVSALIDDLSERGMPGDVLIVMVGGFGRTPKVFTFDGAETKSPRRDHWNAIRSAYFEGGGFPGGAVFGESDLLGACPKSDPHTPENLAATSCDALGLPRTIVWEDRLDRPHQVYHGDPIRGLI
jgi:uncharacterized protein (DUF1501 family)